MLHAGNKLSNLPVLPVSQPRQKKPKTDEEKKELTLAYWDIRGLASHARLLLAYAGADYDDKHYTTKAKAGGWDRTDWSDKKYTLGLDFPNLPYLEDGSVRITESLAILRYVGRKFNLEPASNADKAKADMLEGVLTDIRRGFARISYSDNHDALKGGFLDSLHSFLEQFNKYLENNKWCAGEKLSWVDFHAFTLLEDCLTLQPDCLDKHAMVKAYVAAFEALEPIKKFHASSAYTELPINNKMAAFGGKLLPAQEEREKRRKAAGASS